MIPVYKPWLTELEKKYLEQAINSSWISSTGPFIEKAEELFANFVGARHCILTSSGTTALHLCLRVLDNPPINGDTRKTTTAIGQVVIPDTTFVATAFAASYDNRHVRIMDVDSKTWNLNLDILETALKNGECISTVIPVHLYGNPTDMVRLQHLQKQYKFKIIEDACEALNATISNKHVGVFSDVSCFSFYGNKSLSCGEGGAVITNDDQIAFTARLLRGQAQDPSQRYWHLDIGYNYRITNMQAAILCGQLERASTILTEKERVADRYHHNLKSYFSFQEVLDGHKHSNWLVTLKLPVPYSNIENEMRRNGVDVRKIFYPISSMPPYFGAEIGKVAEELSNYGLSLPSYPQLTNEEIDFVCETLLKSVANAQSGSI